MNPEELLEPARAAAREILEGRGELLRHVAALLPFLRREEEQGRLERDPVGQDHLFLLIGVDSDAENYPPGAAREDLEPDARSRYDAQRREFENAVRPDVTLACRWFLAKYSA